MRSILQSSILILVFLTMAGCAGNKAMKGEMPGATAATGENPYIKSYFSLDKPSIALQPDPDGPKLFRGNDKDTDNNRMLVKGFDMLGYSSFEAGDVPAEQALEQAKLLKADLVLLYTKQSAETPVSVKIQQLREQALRKKSNPEDKTTVVADNPTYQYYASYWVKIAPPIIGVHVKGVSKNTPAEGLVVLAAVEGSPADKAGLKEGDLLKRIGNVDLVGTASLNKVVQQYAGKTVDVTYERDGELKTVPMTLNVKN